MCKFKSGIQFKNRNVLTPLNNESHSDLLENLKIEDNRYNASTKFVRVELVPPEGNIAADISRWKYMVDQDIVPDWFDLDRKKYEESFRKDVSEWISKNMKFEEICGYAWTSIKDGNHIYHFMYGTYDIKNFGKNNNYTESKIREELINSELSQKLKEKFGNNLAPITLNLTAMDGSREYGFLEGDVIAIPTVELIMKFGEEIPLIDKTYWLATPNQTKKRGDSFFVHVVGSRGGVGYFVCDWRGVGVRPFFITKS